MGHANVADSKLGNERRNTHIYTIGGILICMGGPPPGSDARFAVVGIFTQFAVRATCSRVPCLAPVAQHLYRSDKPRVTMKSLAV